MSRRPVRRDAAPPARRQRNIDTSNDPRDLAARLLASIEVRSAFSDKLLASSFKERTLPAEFRGRVTRLVKGVLRRRGQIDFLLDLRLRERLGGLPVLMRQILRLGVYQLLDSNVPRALVVNETVQLANKYGHPGTAGLVNAVLRRLSEVEDLATLFPQSDDAASLAARTSHPVWMVERWLALLGIEATRGVLAANLEERPTFLRPNPFTGGLDALRARLDTEKVAHSLEPLTGLVRLDGRFAPPDSEAYLTGLATAQDPAEFLVTRLAAPKPGQRWWDACAAPGGKATALVEAGADRVVASDLHPSRLRRARENAARLGTPHLAFTVSDARRAPFRGGFDGILLDAPCSGLGVLARRADARWRKEATLIPAVAALQAELLESVAPLLGPGGVLVYSVCSFEPEETVDLVRGFLVAHPEFRLEDPAATLPTACCHDGMFRVLPGEHDMDGAFAARMVRT